MKKAQRGDVAAVPSGLTKACRPIIFRRFVLVNSALNDISGLTIRYVPLFSRCLTRAGGSYAGQMVHTGDPFVGRPAAHRRLPDGGTDNHRITIIARYLCWHRYPERVGIVVVGVGDA
jgi:hypothetical protein